MKKILTFCGIIATILLLSSCTVKNISNIKQSSTKSSSKVKKLSWASKEDIKNVMNSPQKPVSVLFGKSNDQQSFKAIELIKELDKQKDITILNLNEPWVYTIFQEMELTVVPTLLILDPVNEDGSKEMLGYSAIRTYLEGIK